MATLTLRTGVYLGKVGKRASMHTDQKWKWAGIVSVVSIVGVLLTDVVANVVAGYISDQIKGWEVPEQATAARQASAQLPETIVAASEHSFPERQASVAPQALSPSETQPKITARAQTFPTPESQSNVAVLPPSETQPEAVPSANPPPRSEPQREVTGRVEQVIDTGTLKIEGETIHLAGITGLGSPYRDQLQKFIEEQGKEIRCTASGARHTCFVKNVDLALAALTNGAARLSADASPQYQHAAEDARRNRRGIFQ
jgi:endonuclease YncB( thermonuclease family)